MENQQLQQPQQQQQRVQQQQTQQQQQRATVQERKKRLALEPFSCSSRRTTQLVPGGANIPRQASKQAEDGLDLDSSCPESLAQGQQLKALANSKTIERIGKGSGNQSCKQASKQALHPTRDRVLDESEMSLLPGKHQPDSQSSSHRADLFRGTNQGRQRKTADGHARVLQVIFDDELSDVVVGTGVNQFESGDVLPYPAVTKRALNVGAVSPVNDVSRRIPRRQCPVDSFHGGRYPSDSHQRLL